MINCHLVHNIVESIGQELETCPKYIQTAENLCNTFQTAQKSALVLFQNITVQCGLASF